MNTILCILALAITAAAQIPDDPQPQKEICSAWGYDLNGNLASHEIPCSSVPKMDWKTVPPPATRKVGFFTVHRASDPPLRTSKQTLFSPAFYVPEALAWGVATADVKLNGCKQVGSSNAPCGGALYVDAFVPLGIISGAHYFFDRFVCRACSFPALGIVFERHIKGLATGVYP